MWIEQSQVDLNIENIKVCIVNALETVHQRSACDGNPALMTSYPWMCAPYSDWHFELNRYLISNDSVAVQRVPGGEARIKAGCWRLKSACCCVLTGNLLNAIHRNAQTACPGGLA